MMFFFWLFVLFYLILMVLGIKYFEEFEGYVSTFTVFSITGFFYYLAVPIECALTQNDTIGLGEIAGFLPLGDSTKIAISILSVFALIGFGIGLRFSGFYFLKKLKIRSNYESMPKSILFLICILFLILVLFFRTKVFASGTYQGNVNTVYDNPLYSLLVDWIVIFSSVISASNIIKSKFISFKSILFILPGILWGLYASSKDQILISILGILSIYTVVFPPTRLVYIFFAFFGIIIIAPLAMLGFSLFRSGVVISTDEMQIMLSKGIIRNTDPAGPIAVFNDIFNKNIDFKFGSTYLETFYLWIPKFIWPNRPPDLAEKYAQDTLSGWMPGQGLGYSLLIEGYLNFSYFGVLIQYFLHGFLWGKIWMFIMNFTSKTSIFIWQAFYVVYGYYSLIIIHRSPFSGTFKSVFLIVVPLLVFLTLFKKSFWKKFIN